MKKARKAAAVFLVLALVFSLSACGKSEVIGTWQGKIDLTEEINSQVDAAMGSMSVLFGPDVQVPALADYLSDYSVTYVCTFNEDGTFSFTADEASIEASLDRLKSSVSGFTRDLMFAALAYTCVEMGLAESVSTTEELEALLGISLDEAINEALGMSLDEFVAASMDAALTAQTIREELDAQGKYEAKDGKLHMSQGPDEPVFPEIYDLYTVDKDTMTITAGPAGITSGAAQYYPLVLEKVA